MNGVLEYLLQLLNIQSLKNELPLQKSWQPVIKAPTIRLVSIKIFIKIKLEHSLYLAIFLLICILLPLRCYLALILCNDDFTIDITWSRRQIHMYNDTADQILLEIFLTNLLLCLMAKILEIQTRVSTTWKIIDKKVCLHIGR